MHFPVADLPTIVEVLAADDGPRFVVLRYRDFVRFAAIADATPDVDTVLDVGGEHEFVVVSYDGLRDALLTLEIRGLIDEADYLERHRDVAAAVARGALRCGAEHYIMQGYFERRMVRFSRAGQSDPQLSSDRSRNGPVAQRDRHVGTDDQDTKVS